MEDQSVRGGGAIRLSICTGQKRGQLLAPGHKGGGEGQSGLEPPLSPCVVSGLLH